MRFAVYVDLSRQLTLEERSSIFEVVDSTVPGSGCVGRHKGPTDEIYFSLEAATKDEAAAQAARYVTVVLQAAGMDIDYTIELQMMNSV